MKKNESHSKEQVPKQQQDNEDGVVGDVSASTNARSQDCHEEYLAWWHTRWGILEVL